MIDDLAHRWGTDGTEHICTLDCQGTIHPGTGRGVRAKRRVLTGREYVIPPGKHVGHTVTVLMPYGVSITPSHNPGLKHRVRCSCGEEWDMADRAIASALDEEERP